MKRRNAITLIVRALLLSFLAVLAGGSKSYAQESDIKAAVDVYHAALGSLDVSKMEPLWAHDTDVILINPADKSISVGWDAVKKGWEAQFNFLSELKVTQADGPYVSVKGDVAWSTGIAKAVAKSKTGADVGRLLWRADRLCVFGDASAQSVDQIATLVYESDVFERRDGQWLLVSHTALAVSKPM